MQAAARRANTRIERAYGRPGELAYVMVYNRQRRTFERRGVLSSLTEVYTAQDVIDGVWRDPYYRPGDETRLLHQKTAATVAG
jgi:hypothetical protein